MYAKPKRGKTAQGEWKDIVNVKDYTQTLRMEKCLWVENVVEVGSQLPPAAAEANDFPSLTSSILEGDISFAHFYVSLSLSHAENPAGSAATCRTITSRSARRSTTTTGCYPGTRSGDSTWTSTR